MDTNNTNGRYGNTPYNDPHIIALARAIRTKESGDINDPNSFEYGAVGDAGKSHGAYQFQPKTWAEKSQKYFGRQMDIKNKFDQDAVAYKYIEDMVKNSGFTPQQIFAAWNAGEGKAKNGKWKTNRGQYYAEDGTLIKYDTPDYVKKATSVYDELVRRQNALNRTQTVEQPIIKPIENIDTQSQDTGVLGSIGDAIKSGTQTVAREILMPTGIPKMGVSAYNVLKGLGEAAAQKYGANPEEEPYNPAAVQQEFTKSRNIPLLGNVEPLKQAQVGGGIEANLPAIREAAQTGVQLGANAIAPMSIGTAQKIGRSTGFALKQLAKQGAAAGAIQGTGEAIGTAQDGGDVLGDLMWGTLLGSVTNTGLGLGTLGAKRGITKLLGTNIANKISSGAADTAAVRKIADDYGVDISKLNFASKNPQDVMAVQGAMSNIIDQDKAKIYNYLVQNKTMSNETREIFDNILKPTDEYLAGFENLTAKEAMQKSKEHMLAPSFVLESLQNGRAVVDKKGTLDTFKAKKFLNNNSDKIQKGIDNTVDALTEANVGVSKKDLISYANSLVDNLKLGDTTKDKIKQIIAKRTAKKTPAFTIKDLDNLRVEANTSFKPDSFDASNQAIAMKVIGDAIRGTIDLTNAAESKMLTKSQKNALDAYTNYLKLYGANEDAKLVVDKLANTSGWKNSSLLNMASGVLTTGGGYNPVAYLAGQVLSEQAQKQYAKSVAKNVVSGAGTKVIKSKVPNQMEEMAKTVNMLKRTTASSATKEANKTGIKPSTMDALKTKTVKQRERIVDIKKANKAKKVE